MMPLPPAEYLCTYGPDPHAATWRLDRMVREYVTTWDCVHDWEYPHTEARSCDFERTDPNPGYWVVSYACDEHLPVVQGGALTVEQVLPL